MKIKSPLNIRKMKKRVKNISRPKAMPAFPEPISTKVQADIINKAQFCKRRILCKSPVRISFIHKFNPKLQELRIQTVLNEKPAGRNNKINLRESKTLQRPGKD